MMATCAVVVVGLHAASVVAQTNTKEAVTRPPQRFLFIVETSRAMRPRARGVFNELKQALDSGLNGQIRKGDTVGIWTFNENVSQAFCPWQEWSQATQLAVAVRLPVLLEMDTYQKRCRLEKLIPEMLQAISGSEAMTVVLVTSGEGQMRGTPFNEQINAAWKEWHDEQDGVQMPLVTVLRAQLDEITEWSFTPAPRAIELPTPAKDGKSSEEKALALKSSHNGQTTDSTPTKLGPEQQVAFSLWGLGRTGIVATVPDPTTGAPAAAEHKNEQSSETGTNTTVPAAAGNPAGSSRIVQGENQNANGIPAEAPSQPMPVAVAYEPQHTTSERKNGYSGRSQIADGATASGVSAEQAIAATATNTIEIPTEPAAAAREKPATVSKLAEDQPLASGVSQVLPKSDGPSGIPLVALARGADASEGDSQAQDTGLASPPRGFLRNNINPLLLLSAATFGAAYCFRMWFHTHVRPRGNTMSLTRTSREE